MIIWMESLTLSAKTMQVLYTHRESADSRGGIFSMIYSERINEKHNIEMAGPGANCHLNDLKQ